MKILVLQHTSWIEMLANNWSELNGIEIRSLPLPVTDWNNNPELKRKIARLIVDLAEIEKPAFILDVNGAGIMPLDDEFKDWTSMKVDVPWVEWWWDDPMNYFREFAPLNCLEQWYDATQSSNITHFFWDKQLAAEYSRWFKKECFYLPTATHPKAFSPESAGFAKMSFPASDISFLGTFYDVFSYPSDDDFRREINFILEKRLHFPLKNYFEILEENTLPFFSETVNEAMQKKTGCFTEDLQQWRFSASALTGIKRRNEVLEKIYSLGLATAFYGNNWPEKYNASSQKLYSPAELSALYRRSCLNADLGNGQAFTGSNMRVYEIMSSGSIAVLGSAPDFDLEFSLKNKVYLSYDSVEELKYLCAFYQENRNAASEIKENARIYILQNHTWLKRLFTIFSVLAEKA